MMMMVIIIIIIIIIINKYCDGVKLVLGSRTTVYLSKKKRGKVYPRTSHEDSEREWKYSFTLCLTLALDRGGWSTPTLGRLGG